MRRKCAASTTSHVIPHQENVQQQPSVGSFISPMGQTLASPGLWSLYLHDELAADCCDDGEGIGLAYPDDIAEQGEEIGPHVSALRSMIRKTFVPMNKIWISSNRRGSCTCWKSFWRRDPFVFVVDCFQVSSASSPKTATSSSECRWSR